MGVCFERQSAWVIMQTLGVQNSTCIAADLIILLTVPDFTDRLVQTKVQVLCLGCH